MISINNYIIVKRIIDNSEKEIIINLKNIKIKDKVLCSDNKWHEITNISPIYIPKNMLNLKFNNKIGIIRCSGDHLWTFYYKGKKYIKSADWIFKKMNNKYTIKYPIIKNIEKIFNKIDFNKVYFEDKELFYSNLLNNLNIKIKNKNKDNISNIFLSKLYLIDYSTPIYSINFKIDLNYNLQYEILGNCINGYLNKFEIEKREYLPISIDFINNFPINILGNSYKEVLNKNVNNNENCKSREKKNTKIPVYNSPSPSASPLIKTSIQKLNQGDIINLRNNLLIKILKIQDEKYSIKIKGNIYLINKLQLFNILLKEYCIFTNGDV